jgi:hypothetical protein
MIVSIIHRNSKGPPRAAALPGQLGQSPARSGAAISLIFPAVNHLAGNGGPEAERSHLRQNPENEAFRPSTDSGEMLNRTGALPWAFKRQTPGGGDRTKSVHRNRPSRNLPEFGFVLLVGFVLPGLDQHRLRFRGGRLAGCGVTEGGWRSRPATVWRPCAGSRPAARSGRTRTGGPAPGD